MTHAASRRPRADWALDDGGGFVVENCTSPATAEDVGRALLELLGE